MRRGLVAFLVVSLVGLGLVGCGRFAFEAREPWRTEAEEACLARKLVQPSAYVARIPEIDGPGACGMTYPFKVAAFADGSVALATRVTLACPIIPEIDGWFADTVQPAAELYFGTRVTTIRAGTYSCRGRNNQPGAKISEHAFGNAMDVMSFEFEGGRKLSVERGWRGAPEEQDFLREVFVGACRHFTTVLAPGSDVFHYNHLHLDLARHDPRGRRHICKPIIKFTPRLDPDAIAGGPGRAVPAPATRPLPELSPVDGRPADPGEPLELDEDQDPYAVSSAPGRTIASARDVAGGPAASPAQSVPGGAGRPLVLHPDFGSGRY